ncbi:carboxypeptidase regulatory-like domain-containing protein [Kordia sp. YSTF-M3]|uniref:Carboxypeptidase regulatory-like domain-containing protein n=1 Tax=Kordia aestuariivivens TaxID=2759037 RepID=A0ABR7Q9C6_9FLAO|nr:TonB-dependent receptor [Kordia aestuariivivens]MBC8755172.1 carboxypeptidase regulatory-like domain-containing protein [Kordia aestuariivivens]
MKKLIFLFGLLSVWFVSGQNTITGKVLDANTDDAIQNVLVSVAGNNNKEVVTDASGVFKLTDIAAGKVDIVFTKDGYSILRMPITVVDGQAIDLGTILLKRFVQEDVTLISLTDDELNDDSTAADNISGLLQSSRDIYLRTAAFEFGATFFRVRGLDSENGTVLINGIKMNKQFNGRPQWSNWGGLNDVVRNQELTNGLSANDYTFGGILGTTNINTRASQYREGGRVTYSSSNRSYTNRIMATYSSGLLESGWAYTVSAGRRWGDEGFNDGTFYDANSLFVSVEKKLNDRHSINFTGIYAPNRRGQSSANTQEVFDLKGIKYNDFWGYQDGKKRNARVRRVDEPILMLNHNWNIAENTSLQTSVAYQFGEQGRGRLDFGGTDLDVSGFPIGSGVNPSPTYYQKLPSFFARNNPENPALEFGAQQEFINNGQIDWAALYGANQNNLVAGGNAINIVYEDRSDDKQFTANTILNTSINDNITINAGANFTSLTSENFAEITDLLGGRAYLDVDNFADDLVGNPNGVQNDIRNPNRLVGVGDRFRYNFEIQSNTIGGFAQAQFKYKKVDFFVAASVENTTYQRTGLYQNGGFANNSFGEGEKLSFTGIGAKGGLTYKLTGRHLFDFNGAYITKAPSIRNTFSNSRENHNIVPNISEEKITSFDASYIYRSPIIKARLTGYYTKMQDANEISFFFADGIGGDNQAFVQEILQGVDKQHIGAELGIEVQATSTIKLKGVASLGQYTYANNPDLYLSSEDFEDGTRYLGESTLKDYRVAGGPQRAFSLGFEYRDPDYWWFGATTNFFSNAYIDVSPLQRSSNFYTDFDGQPFNDYDPELARELLRQEQFDDYMLVNLIGGKSWKLGDYYVGLFASINNVFGKEYKTGGFEQGRNANFRELRDDSALETRVFGNRYWYGRGRTYFLNLYFRF